ncbi:MAG: ATP-grasp fold amidoligase family protein [Alphaproteobacteria bacterium]
MGIIKIIEKHLLPEQTATKYLVSRQYQKIIGRPLNLANPKTFNEKLQHRKVFDRDERLPMLADKVLVKEFVANKIGAQHVIPTLWNGSKFPPVDLRSWPTPYVIKMNHASAWNIFVRSEEEKDWNDIERCVNKWMNKVYAPYSGEWHYSKIAPQILVEPFIAKDGVLPIDYKLFVFNGRVAFIQVDTDREHGHKRIMYDRNWNRLPFSMKYPMDSRDIPPPNSLNKMIEFSEILSENISFVRVDFYEIDEKPLFGEMTFFPGAGYSKFMPEEYDLKLGELWK